MTDNCSQINLGVVNPAPAPADLVPIIVDLDTATAVPDPVTGTYDGIKLSMRIRNVGTGDLPANSNAIYRSILNIMGGGQSTNAGNLTSVLASGNRTGVIEHIYNNIPFGNHQMCVEVNLNPKNYVDETNMANNNGVCSTLDLAVPPPDLQISAEPKFVRAGGKTNLNWSIEVGYELVCTLRGSGIDQTFTVGTGPGTSYNGSQETGVLNSTAVYRLSCTEPTTSTSFDPIEVKVEVVPGYEEV